MRPAGGELLSPSTRRAKMAALSRRGPTTYRWWCRGHHPDREWGPRDYSGTKSSSRRCWVCPSPDRGKWCPQCAVLVEPTVAAARAATVGRAATDHRQVGRRCRSQPLARLLVHVPKRGMVGVPRRRLLIGDREGGLFGEQRHDARVSIGLEHGGSPIVRIPHLLETHCPPS